MTVHEPQIVWAELPTVVLVTIRLQDSKDVNVKTMPESVEVACVADEKKYFASLDLKGTIVPEESSYVARPRQIEMKLQKKDEGYWNGLTKKKARNVQVDWSRWVDEDEATGKEDTGDFGGMNLGNMAGMPGLGGLGGEGDLGGVNLGGGGDPEQIQQMLAGLQSNASGVKDVPEEEDDDDDDDDMPSLEKKD